MNLLISILIETFKALIGKIAFKAVLERFITRLVIAGLVKLESMTSNDVGKETIKDIVESLRGKKLAVIDKGV